MTTGCPNCQRPFTAYNIFCMGCGKTIFQDYSRQLGHYLKGNESAFDILRENKNRIDDIISELNRKKTFGQFYSRNEYSIHPDVLRYEMQLVNMKKNRSNMLIHIFEDEG